LGIFTLPQLTAATYNIPIENTGFKSVTKQDVVLSAGDRLNAGTFTMEIGTATESIVVKAEGGDLQLQSQSGERANVISPVVLRDIALNGRNVFDLFKTLPGVVANPSASNAGLSGTSRFNVNGTRSGMSDFSIDGATSKNTGDMATSGVSVNPDAIAEVKIVSSNYQAEYGRAGGANIQFVTKSGTNDFHASGRYFRRHDSMNANNYFNTLIAGQSRPRYRYNYYGYDVAGPVIKNRLFFFWNQEYYRQALPQNRINFWTPTDLERQGNFSQTKDGTGKPVIVKDPNGSGPFPNNVVPTSRIYAAGQSTLAFFPQSNFSGSNQYNYTSQASNDYPRREDIVRVDSPISQKTQVFVHYVHNSDKQEMPYGPPFSSWPWPLSKGEYSQPGHNISASLVHTFSPTLINEFVFSRQELKVNILPMDDNVTRTSTGISTPLLYPDALRLDAAPSLAFGGVASLSAPYLNTGFPFLQSMPITNFYDNLTKVVGNHTFKAGIYVHVASESTTKTVNAQTQSRIDFGTNSANPLDSGHPFSNALLGVFNAYSQSATWVEATMKYRNLEWYVQDSWRVRRGLTLDIGLRFVNATYPKDETFSRPFYLDLYSAANAPRLYTPILLSDGTRRVVDPANVPASPSLANTLPYSYANLVVPNSGNIANGTTLVGSAITSLPAVLLAPRFGFAYSPFNNDKTVIRGGFGISYDRSRTSIAGQSTINPPNGLLTTLQYGYLQDLASLSGQGTYGAPSVDAYPRSATLPRVMSFSLGVQHNIGLGMVLDVSYVANLQRHLAVTTDLNSTPYGYMFTRAAQDPSRFAGGVVPAVEPNLPAAYAAAGLNFTGQYALATNLRRPYPGIGSLTYRSFDGSANYNSLQVSLNRRFARSLTLNAAYTYSKTLGTAWDDHSGGVNPYDTRNHEYRLADWDRTHIFSINYVYSLPRFSQKIGGGHLTRYALDGWQISGLSTAATGTPTELGMSIAGAGGWAVTGSDSLGPRLLRTSNAQSAQTNPASYIVPTLGSVGYGPRTYFRNPGYVNHDLSIFKNFSYSSVEGRFVQLRLEMFNVLNHPNFTTYNLGTNLTAPNGTTGLAALNYSPSSLSITNNLRPAGSTQQLGTYFGEYNGALAPRIIQLGVKVYF
ncbi:MAG TPA: TonB-dependent receptor, partial [Bryobacteraceae bacterium]|nr:TonB-dependent receptor [Bryobacteraceae bacterium]